MTDLEGILFTRSQAEGALPNGTRVEKIKSREGDTHKDYSQATVIGSIGPIAYDGDPRVFGYFIEWDDYPGIPAFVAGNRIREVSDFLAKRVTKNGSLLCAVRLITGTARLTLSLPGHEQWVEDSW